MVHQFAASKISTYYYSLFSLQRIFSSFSTIKRNRNRKTMTDLIHSLTGLSNYSLLAIPAIWVNSISAHFYAVSLTKGHFTNTSPREYLASINRKQTKSALDQKYIRAEAAQQNGFENIALFAAALIAGHVAKLPASKLNSLAVYYVISRVAYNVLYIFVTSEKLASLRSVAFLSGIGIIFNLFISSAYALSENQSWLK
ncbi:unnamed protein product [Sympodiomycopsis kandeliae]